MTTPHKKADNINLTKPALYNDTTTLLHEDKKLKSTKNDRIWERILHLRRQENRRRCSHSVSECTFTAVTASMSHSSTDDHKVPVDFSNTLTARIVTDPTETRALLVQEEQRTANLIRNYLREHKSRSCENIAQPWFHERISRGDATTILKGVGFEEGTFLIRRSGTWQGCLVLSVVVKKTVHHYPIIWVKSKGKHDVQEAYYSIDGGKTKFRDLIQLVEFYMVNTGSCLPIRLGSYVTAVTASPCHANLTMTTSI